MNPLLIVGIILIFAGVLFIFLSGLTAPKAETKTGGVVMLGPLPIIFGSDKEAVLVAVIGAIILMIIAFIFFWYFH